MFLRLHSKDVYKRQNRQNGDACGVCPSCRQHTALTHPDLHFVFPMVKVDKKKRICDDYLPEWTEFLKENTYFGIDSWLRYINADNKQAVIYGEESESILRKMSLKSYESPYKIMTVSYTHLDVYKRQIPD